MTYLVNPDGTIEVVSYDEIALSLESGNVFLEQWMMDHPDDLPNID
jgi:hypothetical protein